MVFSTLSNAFSQVRSLGPEGLSDAERGELGHLTDAALAFASTKAYPTITAVGDETFEELYLHLAKMLIECSFGMGNQLLGRTETPVSRQRAVEGLEIARLVLRVAPSDDLMALVDRNLALLKVTEVLEPSEAASVYLSTLDVMQQYAGAEAFSAAIADLLIIADNRNAPELLSVVVSALVKAPQHLIHGELIMNPLVRNLFALIGEDYKYERIADMIGPLCQVFSSALRATNSEDAAKDFLMLIQLALNTSNRQSFVREQLLDLFRQARACMDEGVCSLIFINTILNAATLWLLLGPPDEHLEAAAAMPFQVSVSEIASEEWHHLLSEESERELARHIVSVRRVFAFYLSPDGKPHVHMSLAPNIDDLARATDSATATILDTIISRLRDYSLGQL